jgi:hypothetical protein
VARSRLYLCSDTFKVQVKIQFFGDTNPLQNSSNDILFFSSPTTRAIPYNVQVLGLVYVMEIEGVFIC